MRRHAFLLLGAGLSLLACNDTIGPSTGTLRVFTHTEGDDPDQDGYVLRMDDASLDLQPSGTAGIALAPGRRALRLLGVASHCSVAPAAILEIEILSEGTTSVTFEISCPGTGVRVTTEATGLDFDRDGYQVMVDGSEVAGVPWRGSVYARLDPGSRSITLAGLAPNCTVEGSAAHVVTVTDAEVVSVEFTASCTATNGVVRFVISGRGAENQFMASVDGTKPVSVGHGPRVHLAGVPAGDHVMSLSAPPTCSVRTEPQPVTVTVGTLIRDTVEVAFAVSCKTAFRVTAPTTGGARGYRYSVWACHDIMDGCDWGPVISLGSLGPSDTLVVEVSQGLYELYLKDLPSNCQVNGYNPREVRISDGEVLNIVFPVVCS